MSICPELRSEWVTKLFQGLRHVVHTFPFSRSMDSPGQTVSLKSEKFEMDLGRLAPSSEVAEGHTLPF
jgi:hypothetical protein